MKSKLITLFFAAVSLPAAQFLVTIDSSAIGTQTGTVEIQFNPGSVFDAYEPSTATVTAFELGAGSLGSISSGPDGGASGSLPGPLAIVNSDFYNGVVYNVTFGSTASFLVDFAGAAFIASGQTNLTTFSVSLMASSIITAYADLIGDSQLDTFPSSPGVEFTAVSDVPEPSTLGLMTLGLAASAYFIRRRTGSV